MRKSISHCQGKGSLSHNNRTFTANNVDKTRTMNNVTFIRQSISDAYDVCFNEAVARYNDSQKRNDRKIKTSYFESVFKHKPCNYTLVASDKRKSFYEDLVQIGTKEDTGIGTDDSETAAKCLSEYINGFQERNPNFYVFNAVLHMDEATPHLHIDYIPIGHYKRGVDTQNGLAQALKEMGYGTGPDAINRWRIAERKVLEEICSNHGIEISESVQSRGYSYSVAEYKELRETKKILQKEIQTLEKKRDSVMHYKPDYEKSDRLQFEYEEMCKELKTLIKNPISTVRNTARINELASIMLKSLRKAYHAQLKSEEAQAEIIAYNNQVVEKISEFDKSLKEATEVIAELQRENRELSKSEEILKRVKIINSGAVKQAIDFLEKSKAPETQTRKKRKDFER